MCLPGTIEVVREQEGAVSRRAVLAGGGAAALAALLPGEAAAHGRRGRRHKHGHGPHHHRGRVADLTHTFTTDFPTYTGSVTSRQTVVTIPEDGFYAQRWSFDEHTATHLDAPGHFTAGGRLTPQLTPEELVLPIAVIDISRRAASDADAEVTVEDLRRYERRHGRIPKNALVAMYSGWAAKLGTPAFLGRDASGTFHFPGFSADAADYLLDRGRGAAIGVDTISLDPGNSATFPVHVNWLAADHYGIEGLAGLDEIPRSGAVATVGVIPWQEGSGGPARVLATY
jgi:kynurenine formamidase